jgi:pteridine reductase
VLWPEQGKTEAAKSALLATIPLQRMGEPDDVAEAVRWLILDARYTTGQVIRVDGGKHLS